MIRLTKADAVGAEWDELIAFEDWERSLGLTCFREVEVLPDFVVFTTEGCHGCGCPMWLTMATPPPLGEKWRGWA